ncbi:hypothetical protein [Streptomyces afghaniensis]|uniref:hypothetical protein n=1 Tax=Streptomyces afghaniensis TaxID=66865 RepID=UPI00278079EC|nr:hypothetical protein [Streptomyces afghaniensis]MDQ1015513.1 hypothetical protein [Streptomyces afghaniensis]
MCVGWSFRGAEDPEDRGAERGRGLGARRAAGTDLVTRRTKQWAATAPPAGHAEILRRWELFNNARTLTAVAASVILAVLGPAAAGRRRG